MKFIDEARIFVKAGNIFRSSEVQAQDMLYNGSLSTSITYLDDNTTKRGYKIYGDVDFENVKKIAGHITTVPGGVGPMTITMLLYNVLKSAKNTI